MLKNKQIAKTVAGVHTHTHTHTGNFIRKNKGITLIPLVITIVLLLILAGVSIRAIGGENGIIAKTKIAKEENKKSEYKDYLSIAKTEAIVKKGGVQVTLDEYIEQIKADKIEGIKNIEKITEEKAKVVTDEGYIFIITVNTIDYYENENNLPEMDINKANIEFAFNPNTWTNGSVEVTVKKQESKYKIQISKDGTKWKTTSNIIYTENGVVYARLIDEIGRTSDYASRKIDIIDKEKPNNFVPTVEVTGITSLKVSGSTTDKEESTTYGKSGIKQYYFSKDNGSTWVTNDSNSYTFNDLTYAQTYNIKMKAIDNAGNETITNSVSAYPGYIQEGLIAHYDGINNTGNGHSNTTTTWKDISGHGNDMPLYNFNYNSSSGWISDGIVFDGVDDYMTRENPLFNGVGNNHAATIEVISETTKSQYGTIIDLGGQQTNKSGPPYTLWASIVDDGTSRCNSVWMNYKVYNIPQNKIYLNQLNSISFGSDLNDNYVYIDGGNTYIITDTAGSNGWKENIFTLGRDWQYYDGNGNYYPDTHCYFAGKIKSVRIYDRLLSKEEVDLNYKLDNQRYNIK